MKKWIALLLVFALVLGMTACTGNKVEPTETTAEPPTETTTQPPEPTAHELFAEAAKGLKEADIVTMGFEAKEEHTVWQDTFIQLIGGTAVFEGLQGELMGKIDATVTYNGSDPIPFTEYYASGSTYATYDGNLYRDEAEAEDFLERQYPVCLFEAENFATGEIEESETGKILKFSGATAMEEWVAPEYAELKEATAEVTLGETGIESMTYIITYTQGSADIRMEVTTTPKVGTTATLTGKPPMSEDSYELMAYSWAPRIMDRAMQNLNASKDSSASVSMVVLSQAAGALYYGQEIDLAHHSDKPLMKEEIYLSYYDGSGEEEYEYENIYKNGVLTVKVDGETQTGKVTDDYIEEYVLGVYNDYWVETDWITKCDVSAMGELFYFEFGSEVDGCLEYYKAQINENLFGGADPVGEVASGYEEKSFDCYMGVDPDTWLPLSYGVEYVGAYTIEGEEYENSFKYHSQLSGSDPQVYFDITEEHLEETEPENSATPVFYHVTGEDGSEMWLLGTIHVGDERTAYLPQEIYDAFEASDALAVEFNLNLDEENMDNDEEYSEKIMSMYFYDDESEVKDHLDAEVYDTAVKMMKCLGQYNSNLDYMKPFVWESAITGALKDGGRRLFSHKGVDQRFLDMAEEAGKEILDVESAESQVGMLSGFSDGLQEHLLMEALTYSRSEYNRELMELFEMWCAGDEEALRSYLNDEEGEEEAETEEMTEEEKALYEEYRNAMSTERDINMIEVAKGYLESGKTVFYAVGLAHLLTDDGLVDGLRAAGYTVELVQYQK